MSVTAVLSYSSIYSWLLNSCMPHFPNLFFSWLLPKHLAAARFAIFSSYSQKIAASPSHTHTLAHPSQGKGRLVAWLSVLFSFPLVLPRSIGEFYFQFSNYVFSSFREKTYCHLHISYFCVFHLLVRDVFPMLLCPSSSVAVFVYQGGQWQIFTLSSGLLSLQGFHSFCAAHWGFEPAHSQVACYNWCEK